MVAIVIYSCINRCEMFIAQALIPLTCTPACVLGLASRAITGIPGAFNTFRNSPTLAAFVNNMKNPNVIDEGDDETLLSQVSPDLPFAQSYLDQINANKGITSTNQFDQSPYGNVDIVDMQENQGFGPMP